MATETLESFNHLQSKLEEAKNSLKGVDENIKRLIGRDPSDLPPRPGQKRPLDDKHVRQPFSKFSRNFENDVVAVKKRNPISVFKRLSERVSDEPLKPSSKVIAAPKEIPSRQDVLDKQNKDEKFKARNRRMFGALIGTLQRFQQEESKQKRKEEKRTQIERKIDEHEQQEKAEVKKERQELFLNRKKKQQEIKMIELKMLRMREYAAWEQTQKPRANFILTKAKPQIHYLPRRIDDKSRELLEKAKKDIDEQIEKRQQEVNEELIHIEERMKRNFENKNHIESKVEKVNNDRHDRRQNQSDSEFEDDGDIKMRTLSPELKEELSPELKEEEEKNVTEIDNNKVEEVTQEETVAKGAIVDNNSSEEMATNDQSQNNISDNLGNNGEALDANVSSEISPEVPQENI
ncbi:unnamed protein product [Ceutorhynchus assimilis]|uniref:Pinin n=1 Tax=Ceutorhynchus assimilis TaxID=467358 RepID=A0A9N9QI04_9CUCU|nr:unnamed protein product [Ceutorhynchus assimilis]